jgi:hypothetical protein
MTTAQAYETTPAPKAELKRVPTPSVEFIMACTPPPIDLAVYKGEYSDKQFFADLKKASQWVDEMGQMALKEHAEGKTRKLP